MDRFNLVKIANTDDSKQKFFAKSTYLLIYLSTYLLIYSAFSQTEETYTSVNDRGKSPAIKVGEKCKKFLNDYLIQNSYTNVTKFNFDFDNKNGGVTIQKNKSIKLEKKNTKNPQGKVSWLLRSNSTNIALLSLTGELDYKKKEEMWKNVTEIIEVEGPRSINDRESPITKISTDHGMKKYLNFARPDQIKVWAPDKIAMRTEIEFGYDDRGYCFPKKAVKLNKRGEKSVVFDIDVCRTFQKKIIEISNKQKKGFFMDALFDQAIQEIRRPEGTEFGLRPFYDTDKLTGDVKIKYRSEKHIGSIKECGRFGSLDMTLFWGALAPVSVSPTLEPKPAVPVFPQNQTGRSRSQ